jgi:hypothetical protein
VDYQKVFEDFKLDLLNAHNAYHPNYQLEWVLCVDASDYAVGGVLLVFQMPEGATSEKQFQVVAFVSKKLTPTARKWSVIEKECFSIFFSVKKPLITFTGRRLLSGLIIITFCGWRRLKSRRLFV